MKIEIWFTGKSKGTWIVQGIDAYVLRCKRYAALDITVIPESKYTQADAILTDESERILARLRKSPRAYTVLLDVTGRSLSSDAFAELISQQFVRGYTSVRFIIGGAYGVTAAVKEAADFVLSLSAMTFPHQLVRLIFLEQLYRAFTILRSESYHHD